MPLASMFDQSHLLKNVRNQFLDKFFLINGQMITSDFIKQLYEIEKNSVMKAVRFLTRKHVYPDSLERVQVKFAIDFFGSEVSAALEF